MTRILRTVTGDVPASACGPTLAHEHLVAEILCYWDESEAPELVAASVAEQPVDVRRAPWAVRENLLLQDLRVARSELARFADAGGRTVIEVTPHGLGRDVRALAWLSRETGVQIVAGCGYYSAISHPPGLGERRERAIAEEMSREILEGIGGTGVRAGVIGELGASDPLDPVERRVLRAAGRAQQETGAAVVVHTAPGTQSPFDVAKALVGAGADPAKVVISHIDERFRDDLRLFKRLAAIGCRFGLDTFGRDLYYRARGRQHPSDAVRIEAVLRIVDAGLIDHILVAQDICHRHELAACGGWGYDHILRVIRPRLEAAGLGPDEIETILERTPAEVFGLPG
jgi:phosphotriesterase-related protein